MKRKCKALLLLVAFLVLAVMPPAKAQAAEKRVALVVGNAGYQAGALPTPANDAGLIAQTLQAAGFDVVGARDLDQDSLRRTFRDFIAKVSAAGPDTVAFVYFSGYGLQLEGENYFVPTDANIVRDTNVSSEALRVSDYTKPLAGLGIKASIIVLDVARANPFAKSGPPLAGGLALVEPEPGTLIAFNAAPGTVAQNETGPYSAYAQALAEMMREGGLPVADLFNRVRLRVNEITKGAQVPWNASKLQAPFYFFERAPDAPPPPVSAEQTSTIRSKPIRDFDARDAYLAALDRDNLQDYENFLIAYPNDPMARRVRAIVAARREAATWRRSRSVDTAPAYWSYLSRYPRGSHANDARRRLAYLTAALEPPPRFEVITYDVPPPPPEEVIYIERPVLFFDDPDFGFEPPPPPPIFFLPPRPVYFVDLAPPPPPFYEFVLPIPIYVPVPVWCNPPAYISPPPNNVIYNNIHNTVIINNTTNIVTITKPGGEPQTFSPPAQSPSRPQASVAGAKSPPTGGGAAALLGPSLPPSVAPKAIPVRNTTPTTTPSGQALPSATTPAIGRPPVVGQPSPAPPPLTPPTTPGRAPKQTAPEIKAGQPLPGSGGQPLPPINGKPPVTGQPLSPPSPSTQPAPQAQAPKATLPEIKGGRPLPGSGGRPLPPINGKPPVTGQPSSAPTQPKNPAVTPASPPLSSGQRVNPGAAGSRILPDSGASRAPPIARQNARPNFVPNVESRRAPSMTPRIAPQIAPRQFNPPPPRFSPPPARAAQPTRFAPSPRAAPPQLAAPERAAPPPQFAAPQRAAPPPQFAAPQRAAPPPQFAAPPRAAAPPPPRPAPARCAPSPGAPCR